MAITTSVPEVHLNNGVTIPQLGFGVFQIKPEDTVEAVTKALEIGYRHFDTAEMYGNEKEVGQAINASDIPRDEVFVTSKLNNGFHAPDDARRAFDKTLEDLGMEKIDLFLIHWPLPAVGDFVETWLTMEEFYRDGRARSIGVSNFQTHHLNRLFDGSTVRPAVNQIEVHPYLTQAELRSFDTQHQIATESWSPIAQGGVLNDPVITQIAKDVGKSPAQVVLRWHVQLDCIVFPKSITPSRMKENFEIFDFELTESQMGQISSMNKDERTGPNPDEFNYIPS